MIFDMVVHRFQNVVNNVFWFYLIKSFYLVIIVIKLNMKMNMEIDVVC